ncbi:MAG: DUF4397 domain-containing protein [Gemmatimonadaceae bacterium]|nr:DUF4397 domain-containing protein [Gemmatimonadaceae bacterium]
MRIVRLAPSARSLLSLPIASLALLAACNDSVPTGGGPSTATTHVRVVQAIPDAPALDLLVSDTVAFSGLTFDTVTDYATLGADSDTVVIRRSSDQQAVLQTGFTLGSGVFYTLVLYNPLADPHAKLFLDDTTTPPNGNAKLRVIHLAPSMGIVDLYLSAPGTDITAQSPIRTGITFPFASVYLPVIAGTYDIRFTETGTKNIVLDMGNVTLGNGQNRTIALLDHAGLGLPISAVVLKDRN